MNASKKPYIIEIKKFKNNEKLINNVNKSNFSKNFSPLSGSEMNYDPYKYNKNNSIKKTHNCYTYALGKIINELEQLIKNKITN